MEAQGRQRLFPTGGEGKQTVTLLGQVKPTGWLKPLGAQSHQAGLVQSSWEGLAVAVQEAPLAAQFALPNSE